MTSIQPRATVYVPSHDYGRFLQEALDSIGAQTFTAWEAIVIDDGSTDETAAVAEAFRARFADRVRVVRHETRRGLHACANAAFALARGEYVMRLDADDILDENALLVLVSYLDQRRDVDLVYPNYHYIDEQGRHLGFENRKKVGREARLLDLPAHGACTLVRKRVLKAVGGFSETATAQDGYELWLNVLQRHQAQVGNVETPLFSYRQHGASLSRDRDRILAARRQVKRDAVGRNEGPLRPRVAAIIAAKNTDAKAAGIVLESCAGRPLLEHTVQGALDAGVFDHVLVTTDDERVVEYCRRWPSVLAELRPLELSLPGVRIAAIIDHAVNHLERAHQIYPDIVVQLSVLTPMRRPEHVREALDTLLAYDCDCVVSVYEDFDLHFIHGAHGLEPLNPGVIRQLQLEREALYVDNMAIHALWRDVVRPDDIYGRLVGHIVMPWRDSVQARTPAELAVVELLMRQRGDVAAG
jgi:CMP-N-acetylneuraminic acid synthetase